MQSTFVIGGKLGFEGRLLAAIVNTRGGLSKKLSYEFKGDGAKLSCVCSGTLAGEDEPRTVTVTFAEAKTDNQIWQSQPKQKLAYTCAARWARLHCPEVLFGLMTDSEPVETIEATATPTEPEDPNKITSDGIIQSYLTQIEVAESSDEVKRIGERINAELSLPENDREDLRAVAANAYRQFKKAETEEVATA